MICGGVDANGDICHKVCCSMKSPQVWAVNVATGSEELGSYHCYSSCFRVERCVLMNVFEILMNVFETSALHYFHEHF